MEEFKPTDEDKVEMEQRLSKIRDEMKKSSVDIAIISDMSDIFYLTHYQTVGGCVQVVMVTEHDLHLVTREFETSNVRYRCQDVSYSSYNESQDPMAVVMETVSTRYRDMSPMRRIGLQFNSDRLSYLQFTQLRDGLLELYPMAEIRDVSGLICKFRAVKSELELTKMTLAADMVHAGLKAGVAHLEYAGIMETEVGGVVTSAMCEMGCEYTAYPVFLSSGEAGCMAHYTPSQKIVENGEVVFFEVGACYHRYHAARMYSVYMGDVVPEWFTTAETLIRRAMCTGMKMMKPGVVARDVDKVMRDIISLYPHPYTQSERAGYSIGIGFYTDWRDSSTFYINPSCEEVLQEFMTIHLIPWIQIPGRGGMGFSDTVLVTNEGAVSLFREGNRYERGRGVKSEKERG